ncbi:MAG TPA: alpha/beta hydrolase [Bacteroidetes bacterium]|nr:alpha/beta hydrolase [Bacteroidota bacterium]
MKFKVLSIIAPSKAAKLAIEVFSKPHFKKLREREKEFLQNTNIVRLQNDPEDIILYESGDPNGKPVLMVHGWDSNPGSMSGIVRGLAQKGYHVYVLNVPAHGISKLKSTNMIETSKLIIKILEKFESIGEFSFVTHSFGSGAVSFALMQSGIKVDKLAFITSPDKILDIFYDFKNTIGLGNKAYKYMLKFSEQKFQRKFEDMQISNALQKANFNQLLLIHDVDDKILPYSNSLSIHEKVKERSKIVSTKGKGHYRILWDEQVIQEIVDFL